MSQTVEKAVVDSGDVLPYDTGNRRIPELDGLRGLAILLVIICHYIADASHPPLGFIADHLITILDLGWSGVDLFFVLSGFLIGGILLGSRNSRNYFRTFYLRRVHRILPVYYSWILFYVVLVSICVYSSLRPIIMTPPGIALASQDLAIVPKYLLFLQNILYSPRPFEWQWFVVTWSLAVEEQFYLIAPPLIRWVSQRILMVILCLTVIAAPVLRYVSFVYFPQLDHFAQFSMPCRADALSLGILAAIAWRSNAVRSFLQRNPGILQRTTVYLAVCIVALLWWLVRPPNVVTVTAGYSVLAFFYVSLVLLVLSQTNSLVARCMRIALLRRLGGISYCVYIIHLTINELGHRFLLHQEPDLSHWQGILITCIAFVLSITIASVSWKFFEKPLIRRGHRFTYDS
ncbi:MAG TPA: acyltransferase [Candidatus Acidoferrales bacterium]|jgi:peptidoglycan/LPS O-acetylase OafA/YrhL|nr:acyltransferase [Candidatus Acidoferrales bacterium]